MADILGNTPAVGEGYLVAGSVRKRDSETGDLRIVTGSRDVILVHEGDTLRVEDLVARIDERPRVAKISGAGVAVTNTTGPQTHGSYTIPAGAMGPNGTVSMRMVGTMKNDQASTAALFLRISLGGSLVWAGGMTINANAALEMWWLDLLVANRNDAASQLVILKLKFSDAALAAPGPGVGNIDNRGNMESANVAGVLATVDTASAARELLVEWNTATTSADTTIHTMHERVLLEYGA